MLSIARARWSGIVVVLVAASLFGTLGVLSRAAYAEGLTPFAWVSWRALIGTLGLGSLIALRRGPRNLGRGVAAAPRRARLALLLAIVAGAALNLSIFVAFARTTIALALLGFYTYPAIVAGVSVVLGRERLDAARVAALLLALVGMAGVVLGGLDPAGPLLVDGLGIALALVAAVCQATFVLASRGYSGVPTDEAMGTILAGSAAVAVVVTLLIEGPAALLAPLGGTDLLPLLLVVGLAAAALPSFLFLTGIRILGPVRTGIVMLFEPVVGVTLAALLLNERVTPVQALGGATILLAAFLVQRHAAAPDAAPPVVPAPGGP